MTNIINVVIALNGVLSRIKGEDEVTFPSIKKSVEVVNCLEK